MPLEMLATDKIKPGDNPRGEIDTTTETFKDFCSNIKAYGVKQSILVGPAEEDGCHRVIAGHRRYAAAVATDTAEIPALIEEDAQGAELAMALIENIQREDLPPLAEAEAIKRMRNQHGFTQEKAAETLNKSVRWARDREKLLKLPDKAKVAFDTGAIPLESASEVQAIADHAPKAAEALAAAAIADPEIGRAVSNDRISDVLEELTDAVEAGEDDAPDLGCFVEHRPWGIEFDAVASLDADESLLEAIKSMREEIGSLTKDLDVRMGRWERLYLGEEDLSAAETFGCLLTLEGHKYLTDANWLADRTATYLDTVLEEIKARRKDAGKPEDVPSGGDSPEAPADVAERERQEAQKRKEEREDEQQQKEDVRSANLELGQRTAKAFRSAKISLEEEKLVALMAIGADANEMGARGVIYCHHDYQDAEQLKNGKTRVTYKPGKAAGDDLVAEILAAKQPGEATAVVTRALLLAQFADQSCVAPSNRSYWDVPSTGAQESLPALLATIAEKRNVLPDAVRKAVEEQRRAESEEAELALLRAVNSSRAKAGAGHDSLLDVFGVAVATIDGAVSARRIKSHESSAGLSYTMLGNGKKRLEKLKAAEKARQAE